MTWRRKIAILGVSAALVAVLTVLGLVTSDTATRQGKIEQTVRVERVRVNNALCSAKNRFSSACRHHAVRVMEACVATERCAALLRAIREGKVRLPLIPGIADELAPSGLESTSPEIAQAPTIQPPSPEPTGSPPTSGHEGGAGGGGNSKPEKNPPAQQPEHQHEGPSGSPPTPSGGGGGTPTTPADSSPPPIATAPPAEAAPEESSSNKGTAAGLTGCATSPEALNCLGPEVEGVLENAGKAVEGILGGH